MFYKRDNHPGFRRASAQEKRKEARIKSKEVKNFQYLKI